MLFFAKMKKHKKNYITVWFTYRAPLWCWEEKVAQLPQSPWPLLHCPWPQVHLHGNWALQHRREACLILPRGPGERPHRPPNRRKKVVAISTLRMHTVETYLKQVFKVLLNISLWITYFQTGHFLNTYDNFMNELDSFPTHSCIFWIEPIYALKYLSFCHLMFALYFMEEVVFQWSPRPQGMKTHMWRLRLVSSPIPPASMCT